MNGLDPLLVGAMAATEKCATRLNSVANDLAPAMSAFRGKRVNRTFEAIEIM